MDIFKYTVQTLGYVSLLCFFLFVIIYSIYLSGMKAILQYLKRRSKKCSLLITSGCISYTVLVKPTITKRKRKSTNYILHIMDQKLRFR